MTEFTPFASSLGGVLIGVAAALMLAFNGRIAGISGILGGFVERKEGWSWRGLFLLGMLLGAGALVLVMPTALPGAALSSLGLLALAGLLVGFGTRLGGGCTSGHGVCGISRLSNRSLAATGVFFSVAMATTYLARHVFHVGAAL
jgi:uncharacterized membrane protein YedE/YeeE